MPPKREAAHLRNRVWNFKKAGGRVTVSTQSELDGAYRPTDVRENTVTVDFSRTCVIPWGQMDIRDGPERPYRSKVRLLKKVKLRKRRDTSQCIDR